MDLQPKQITPPAQAIIRLGSYEPLQHNVEAPMAHNENISFTDIDERSIGLKLKQGRIELGLTRKEVAGYLGISHQQLEKYEKGANRIPINRLYIICQLFKRPLEWFVTDLPESSNDSEDIFHSDFMRSVMNEVRKVDKPQDQQDLLKLIRFVVTEKLW